MVWHVSIAEMVFFKSSGAQVVFAPKGDGPVNFEIQSELSSKNPKEELFFMLMIRWMWGGV